MTWPENPCFDTGYPESVTVGADGKPYCPREHPVPHALVLIGRLVEARRRGEDWRALVPTVTNECPPGERRLLDQRIALMEAMEALRPNAHSAAQKGRSAS
jgi:hypothetical protein